MTISKIKSSIHPLEQIDKINEIIENNVYQNKVYAYKSTGYKILEGSSSNVVATDSSDIHICYSRFSKVEDITSNIFYSDTACTSRIFHLTGYSPYYEAGNAQLSFLNKTDGLFRAYCYTPHNQYRLVFEFERYATGDVTTSGLIDWEGNDIEISDNDKVSKSGDTMTGGLNFNLTNDIKPIIINMDNATGSQNENLQDIDFRLNDTRRAMIRGVHNSGGGNSLQLHIYDDNATDKGGITVATDSSGNPSITALTPSDNDNSTKIATTAFVKKHVDGQWVSLNQTIITNQSLTQSSGSDLDKTVNVPNDGRTYEVLFDGEVITGAASGNYLLLKIGTNKLSYKVDICGARTRSSSTTFARGNVILQISYASNNLHIARGAGWNGTAELVAVAYRRVGVNN